MNQQSIKLPHEIFLIQPELSRVEWLQVYWAWWISGLLSCGLLVYALIRLFATYRQRKMLRGLERALSPEQEAVSQVDRIVQSIRSSKILEKDLATLSKSLKFLLSQELGMNVTTKTVGELQRANIFKSSRVEVKGYLKVLEFLEQDIYGAAQSLQHPERRAEFLDLVVKGMQIFAQRNTEDPSDSIVSGGNNAV